MYFASNVNIHLNETNLSTNSISKNSSSTEKAKQIETQVKTKNINELKEGWKVKTFYGKYPICTNDADVYSSLTHQLGASSTLKSETERFIIAAKDQRLLTRSFQANILKNSADPKFRVCDKLTETIDRPMFSCT